MAHRLASILLLIAAMAGNGGSPSWNDWGFSLTPVGPMPPDLIDESSGLIASHGHAGIFWTHNDSGDSARIFAIRGDGSMVVPKGTDPEAYQGIRLEGAVNRDFEDIAMDGKGNLIVGDIGNNANQRRDLKVYVLPEPNPFTQSTARVERTVFFHYPEQTAFPPVMRNFDAEALFWMDGKLHLLTKHRADEWTKLYRFESLKGSDTRQPLTLLGSFQAGGMVTGADFSSDGKRLALLTYRHLWLFTRKQAGENPFLGRVGRLPIRLGQCEGVAFAENDILITNEEGFLFRISMEEIPEFQNPPFDLWATPEETRSRLIMENDQRTGLERLETPWIILNEYNAVRHNRWLENDGPNGSIARDETFGRVPGNGGNWFELAAVASPGDRGWLDLRGWMIDWRQDNAWGTIELSDRSIELSKIPTGTLITFAENRVIEDERGRVVVSGSRFPDGAGGDGEWWVHVWTGDTNLVRTGHGFSDGKNTNANFQLRIRDNTGLVVMDWTGEGCQPVSGVNSREVFHLATDPGPFVTPDHPSYTDSIHSSFGKPNAWEENHEKRTQDWRPLRR